MTGDPRDRLELELRQLDGVVHTALRESPEATVVELVVAAGGHDADGVRTGALQLAATYLEGPVTVEVTGLLAAALDDDAPGGHGSGTGAVGRVQLLLALPVGRDDAVEVHLARAGTRAHAQARAGDAESVVQAVLGCLDRLGLPAPFRYETSCALSGALGGGTLVVLRHERTGLVRRGMADGRSAEEALARAVLAALNRYLYAEDLSARAGAE